jgi:ribose-phosphate pyrophosphokinase
MSKHEKIVETIPVGQLGIIALESSKSLGKRVNDYLVEWRNSRESEHKGTIAFTGYQRESYLLNACCPRFGTGEAKGMIKESVRGSDLFLLVDVTNYSMTYSVCGHTNHMSPDDHYQDLKRIIAAVGGKARRITVIMPYLYEGRQHKRSSRESLDCALALQELTNMGVESIITFDAHDPRVQNAIPLKSLETVSPTYQFIKALLKNVPGIKLDSDHMMVISPDEGGMSRAVYYANVLGLDMGMFYKRRDYTKIVNGRNPIVAHEFLGTDVEGKDILIIDDMISSGESILDVATELKRRKANRIFVASTFGLFTGGLAKFDEAYESGLIYRLLTTNLIYQTPELLTKPYYINVDMSKYIALIIDTMNHDNSISGLLNPVERIHNIMEEYHQGNGKNQQTSGLTDQE